MTTAESLRDAIDPIAGTGPIRGVWIYRGGAIAFRDNLTKTACNMWQSTGSGWDQVDLGATLAFTAGVSPGLDVGEIIRGGSSGASARVSKVVVASGDLTAGTAVGTLHLQSQVGTFQSETLSTDSIPAVGTITTNSTAIALSPGGSYDFATGALTGSTAAIKVYGCDGINPGFEWDGLTFVQITTAMAVNRPTHVAVHLNQLFFSFAGGGLESSDIGDPFSWTAGGGSVDFAFGDEITGLISQVQTLTIFGRRTIGMLYGTSAVDWELKTLSKDSGAIPGTIQLLSEPLFLDDGGLRALSQAQAFGDFISGSLTQHVEPLIRAKRLRGITPTCSVRVRSKDKYRVFFTDGTGLSVYFSNKTVQVMPITYGMVVRCAASGEDENGIDFSVFGSDDGYIYRADVGTSFDGAAVDAYLQLAHNHVKSPNLVKRWHSLDFDVDAAPGTELSLDVGFDYNSPTVLSVESDTVEVQGLGAWSASNFATSLWASPASGTIRARISGHGTNMSAKLTSSSVSDEPFTLSGVTVGYTNRKATR